MKLRPEDYELLLYFEPQSDITVQELSLILKRTVLLNLYATNEQFDQLPENIKRHFKVEAR